MKLMMFSLRPFLLLLLVLAATSCSKSTYRKGLGQLDSGSYAEAIQLFEAAAVEDSTDYRVIRDLGVAYYKSNRFDDAIDRLTRADAMRPGDGKTLFYLGMAYEAKGMIAEAIIQYKQYRNLSGSRGFKKEISKRIKQLSDEQVTEAVARAITIEQAIDVEAIPPNTVAVLDFENVADSPELEPLRKGLAQMVITDLAKAREVQVVERFRLRMLLAELEFGQSGLVDQESTPRVGKLLGVRRIVKGGFMDLAGKDIRIDASITEIATTELFSIDEIEGELATIFRLEKKLVFEIIDELGVDLTPEERAEIERIPTESLLAFMAYSRGLDYEDQGLFDQAGAEYQKAIDIDPGFAMARESLEDVEIASKAATEAKVDLADLESTFEPDFKDEIVGPDKMARLLGSSLAAQTGQAPQGDNDTRSPVQEATGTDKPNPTQVIVPIRVPLPDTK